ncbi:hypothetical protein ACJRO7_014812 [Eucalyptus globulus]|uniref:BED-type domain-containing protein n=1 Tax=Eucalyptus globulus TaxID=34317 RepID=A0ABD3L2D5_EUCGL
MSREEDSFRKHVHILPNNKWVCNFCGYEYSGDTRRIRAHLAGVAGYGIQGCENVDSQVRSKALTAWKGKRPAKSSNRQRYLEGGPHLRATPNDEDDCIVTSFAALPDLTSDVISTVAPSSSAFLPLPETVNNEDDWTVTLPVAWPDLSSGVMSTVNASSSAFLPLPKTNLPNRSLPPQNMNPQRDFPFWPRRPQSHAVDSYHVPRSLSHLIRVNRQPDLHLIRVNRQPDLHLIRVNRQPDRHLIRVNRQPDLHLIRVIRQPDLVSKDLTNMLRLVNAKVEEPNTKVPQGNVHLQIPHMLKLMQHA